MRCAEGWVCAGSAQEPVEERAAASAAYPEAGACQRAWLRRVSHALTRPVRADASEVAAESEVTPAEVALAAADAAHAADDASLADDWRSLYQGLFACAEPAPAVPQVGQKRELHGSHSPHHSSKWPHVCRPTMALRP